MLGFASLHILANSYQPLKWALCGYRMLKELVELKEYLIKQGVYDRAIIGIDELPVMEGYCIYDARKEIEVFSYERGQKMDVKYFHDIDDAIIYFKNWVLADSTMQR